MERNHVAGKLLRPLLCYFIALADHAQQKEILSGVVPNTENGNILQVPWDSLLGKIVRKNKLAFRLHSRPEKDLILTDISSVGSVLAGIVNKGLNPDLTSEGVLLRVMASSVYPPRGHGRNTGDP